MQCFVASANAYSATAVLPADVCAATNTLSPRSRRYAASFWNASSSNGNVIAGSGASLRNASSTSVKRSITAHCSSFRSIRTRPRRAFESRSRTGSSRVRDRASREVTRTERNTASTSSSNAAESSSSEASSSAPDAADAASGSDEPTSDPPLAEDASAEDASEPPVSNARIIRSSCVHGAPLRSSRTSSSDRGRDASAGASASAASPCDSAHGDGAKPRGVPSNTPASNAASRRAGARGLRVASPGRRPRGGFPAGAAGRERLLRRGAADEVGGRARSPPVGAADRLSPPHGFRRVRTPRDRDVTCLESRRFDVSGLASPRGIPRDARRERRRRAAPPPSRRRGFQDGSALVEDVRVRDPRRRRGGVRERASRRLARARSASAGARSASNDTRGSSG